MMKIHIVTSAALALSAAGQLHAAAPVGAKNPNVLLLITDQQSWEMVHAVSGNPWVKTPNIDRLVKNGYAFANAFCANAISMPSRWAMFTGESTAAFDMQDNAAPTSKKNEIIEAARTRSMGTLYKKAGYDTYYIGKLHLAWCDGMSSNKNPFNYNFTYLEPDERMKGARAGANFFESRKGKKPFLLCVSLINPHDIGVDKLVITEGGNPTNDKQAKTDAGINGLSYLPKIEALGDDFFLSDRSDPFPANFARTDKHPLDPVFDKFYGGYTDLEWRKYIWFYHRLVEQVDGEIGVVLDALEKSPYKDNTLIIFTSDHGDMGGSHHLAKKNIMYHECERIPLIFSGPGVVGGIDRTTPVCNGWDLVPTMCSIAGIEIPKELRGLSLWPQVTGGAPVHRDYLYLEASNGFEIMQDNRWVYLFYETKGYPEVLYDLQNDPGQLYNIVARPENKAKLEELRAILKNEIASRGLTVTDNRPYSITGLVRNRQTNNKDNE